MLTPEREKEITDWVMNGGDLRKAFTYVLELLEEISRARAEIKIDIEFHDNFILKQANEYLKVSHECIHLKNVLKMAKSCIGPDITSGMDENEYRDSCQLVCNLIHLALKEEEK